MKNIIICVVLIIGLSVGVLIEIKGKDKTPAKARQTASSVPLMQKTASVPLEPILTASVTSQLMPTVQSPQVMTIEPSVTGCEQYRSLVSKYDWDIAIAMAVMEAESDCNTNAVGDTWEIGGLYAPSCGLMQIRTLSTRPSCEELKDPATNIEWAHKIYSSETAWGHWSMFNNGVYLENL